MKSILLALALLAPIASQAASIDVKGTLDKIAADEKVCLNQEMSEMGMKMCAGTAFEATDKLLNQIYVVKVKSLKKAGTADEQEILKRLVRSERAWVAFREANCSYQGTASLGGSNEGLDILMCDVDMTTARVQELERL